MNNLYLRARLAGRDIAIPAACVESVVKISDIVPVPAVSPHIAGLFALRSRVLTIVDCAWFIHGSKGDIADTSLAIVVTIDNHHYGLLVDAVDDILTIDSDPVAATGGVGRGWDMLGDTMLHVDDAIEAARSLLVLDVANAVNPPPSAAAGLAA
ncbi:MAG: chemotaxis protein CheW [Pseudomonadota bacterium]